MTPAALRKLRKRLKFSQAEMAEELGVNQTTIHRWERGERPITGPARRLLEQMAGA